MISTLFDFAVITIFARETLEGGIIIGEYRTIILRSEWNNPASQQKALRTVTITAIAAAFVALVVCAAIAIPLAVLSRNFDPKTAILIEGISKIVAAICLLQLSLKMPKFFGLYQSKAKRNKKQQQEKQTSEKESERTTTSRSINDSNKTDNNNDDDVDVLVDSAAAVAADGDNRHELEMKGDDGNDEFECSSGLTLRSMRFNVAWNIWREVAECGVFLIPFFLTGEGILAIPLSAVVGFVSGAVICLGIYYANQKLTSTVGLTVFTAGLLLILSTGLFSGGCHKFEMVYGYTKTIWSLDSDFWSVERLPMTVFKPFGYSDRRTLLQMLCFWLWLAFGLLLHYRKFRTCYKAKDDEVATAEDCSTADEEDGYIVPEESIQKQEGPNTSSQSEGVTVTKLEIEVDVEAGY